MAKDLLKYELASVEEFGENEVVLSVNSHLYELNISDDEQKEIENMLMNEEAGSYLLFDTEKKVIVFDEVLNFTEFESGELIGADENLESEGVGSDI